MRLAPCPVGPFHFTFSPCPPKVLRAGQKLTQAGEGTGASHSLPRGCFCEALGAPWAAEAKHGDCSGPGSAAAGESGNQSPASGRKRQRKPWSLRRTRSGGGRTRGGGGRLGGGRSGPLARSGCSRPGPSALYPRPAGR